MYTTSVERARATVPAVHREIPRPALIPLEANSNEVFNEQFIVIRIPCSLAAIFLLVTLDIVIITPPSPLLFPVSLPNFRAWPSTFSLSLSAASGTLRTELLHLFSHPGWTNLGLTGSL